MKYLLKTSHLIYLHIYTHTHTYIYSYLGLLVFGRCLWNETCSPQIQRLKL